MRRRSLALAIAGGSDLGGMRHLPCGSSFTYGHHVKINLQMSTAVSALASDVRAALKRFALLKTHIVATFYSHGWLAQMAILPLKLTALTHVHLCIPLLHLVMRVPT